MLFKWCCTFSWSFQSMVSISNLEIHYASKFFFKISIFLENNDVSYLLETSCFGLFLATNNFRK